MAKNYKLEFNIDSDDVKIATDRTLTLKQEIRILSNELANIPAGTKQFEILSKKLNESKDKMADLNIRSKELFGVLGALPGPIGNIGNSLDSSIDLLKTFTTMSTKDLSSKLKDIGNDLKGIGKGLLDLTGITKIYELTVAGLTRVMVGLGLAEDVAARSAKGLGAALTATGIGAIIVAVGYLIANFDELKEAMFGASEETKAYNAVNQEAIKTSGDLIVNETALIEKVKKGGLTKQEQIGILNKWNEKHKDTNLLFEDYQKLQDYVVSKGPQYIEYIKAKAKADANYSLILLKQKELLAAEVKDPAEFRKWYDYFSDQAIFGKIGDVDEYRKNVLKTKLTKEINTLAAQTDTLNEAVKLAQTGAGVVSTETVKPITTKTATTKTAKEDPAVKARQDAITLINNLEEDNYKKTLSQRNKELYEADKSYKNALKLAEKYGLDTTKLKESYRIEEDRINKKYDDEEAKQKHDRLEKEKEWWKKMKDAADKGRKDKFDDEVKALEDKLHLDEASLKSLEEGTAAYVAQQMIIEDDAYAVKKKKAKDNATELETIEKEHEANKTAITEAGENARRALIQQRIDTIAGIGRNLQAIAGKEKGVAKAGVRIEEATTIASVWMNDTAAISKAYKASPTTFGLPWSAVYAAHLGTSIAAAHINANKAIAAIDGDGGGGGGADANAVNTSKPNYGSGGMITGPLHAGGGVMINAEGGEAVMSRGSVTMFAPLLSAMNQMGGGTSFSQGAVGQAKNDKPQLQAQEQMILKTYVVEQELTTSQHKQARLKDLSTL